MTRLEKQMIEVSKRFKKEMEGEGGKVTVDQLIAMALGICIYKDMEKNNEFKNI